MVKIVENQNLKHFLFLRNPDNAPIWGGLENLMLGWFERIDYSQCRVTLAISKDWIELFTQTLKTAGLPVQVIELPFSPRSPVKRFFSESSFLRGLNPSSIIYIHGWLFSFDLVSVLAGSFVTPGRVFIQENLGPPVPPEKSSKRHLGVPGLGIWWYFQILSALLRAHVSEKTVVVSKEIKENLVSFWHYPAEKIAVKYNGIDLGLYRPSSKIRLTMRRVLNIPADETIIVVHARLAKEKCIHRTIEAFDALCQKFSAMTLLILGSGPQEDDLKALGRKAASSNKIRFLGHVDNVADYLKTSDIYVLSSDNEGFGIALVEAMASGLICVSTRCPGPNEIIQDGINGFLVDKSTEGVMAGLRRVFGLSVDEKASMREKAAKFVSENFEINAKIRDVFEVFGLPYKTDHAAAAVSTS